MSTADDRTDGELSPLRQADPILIDHQRQLPRIRQGQRLCHQLISSPIRRNRTKRERRLGRHQCRHCDTGSNQRHNGHGIIRIITIDRQWRLNQPRRRRVKFQVYNPAFRSTRRNALRTPSQVNCTLSATDDAGNRVRSGRKYQAILSNFQWPGSGVGQCYSLVSSQSSHAIDASITKVDRLIAGIPL